MPESSIAPATSPSEDHEGTSGNPMDIGSAQNFSQSSRNTVIAASVVGKSVLFHEICHPIEMITHPATRLHYSILYSTPGQPISKPSPISTRMYADLNRRHIRHSTSSLRFLQASTRRQLRANPTRTPARPSDSHVNTYTYAGEVRKTPDLSQCQLFCSLLSSRICHHIPSQGQSTKRS